jgi:hypothetical protein
MLNLRYSTMGPDSGPLDSRASVPKKSFIRPVRLHTWENVRGLLAFGERLRAPIDLVRDLINSEPRRWRILYRVVTVNREKSRAREPPIRSNRH